MTIVSCCRQKKRSYRFLALFRCMSLKEHNAPHTGAGHPKTIQKKPDASDRYPGFTTAKTTMPMSSNVGISFRIL